MSSSTVTRRAAVAGAGTAVASIALAIPYVQAARGLTSQGEIAGPLYDPLLDAIADYRNGVTAFNAFAVTDVSDDQRNDFAEVTYAPPMVRLEGWSNPATTLAGAREAIRLALEESIDFSSSDMVPALLRASLAYLESVTA
jgi:hypothetical protein